MDGDDARTHRIGGTAGRIGFAGRGMEPADSEYRAVTIFTTVDLPAPLALMSTVTVPGSRARSTPSSTRIGPNDL